MVKKCCVTACQGNYNEKNKVRVFRLPKDQDERERWLKVIPRANTPNHSDTVVCERHFPPGYETVFVMGKARPKDPPSIFNNLPSSVIPSPLPKARTTKKSSASVRSVQNDEFAHFLDKDRIANFTNLCADIDHHDFVPAVTCYKSNNQQFIQSCHFFTGSIPMFLIKIFENLTFECYHASILTHISSLLKNRITKFQHWSQIEEAIRYLSNLKIEQEKQVLRQHIEVMSPRIVGKKVYESEILVRAFEYFATSRSLYNKLRDHYKLPSMKTLVNMTSKVSKVDDLNFLGDVFSKLSDKQKKCIILVDEVYVKVSLQYQGGTIFGGAKDSEEALAKTVLGIMIKCLHGGPKFLIKMIPVAKLNSEFLFQNVRNVVDLVDHSKGHVIAVICDNNRTNQALFKKFDTVENKPWVTKNGIYLLFDYVHIFKSIRNNWITEACSELLFYSDGKEMTAKWEIVKQLFAHEKNQFVKLSKLTEVAVLPKPVERQKVSHCLKVFCDETVTAMKTHPLLQDDDTKETVTFIEEVLKFWKIVSVKDIYGSVKTNDPLKRVLSDRNDGNLTFLANFGSMAKQMRGKQGKRIKSLTRDTSMAIEHTCNGLIDVCRHLLDSGFNFVILGEFTTDYLETEFCKLRQGSGGTYFITVQNVIQKFHIHKTKLLLRLKVDVREYSHDPGHTCSKCGYLLDELACQTVDHLPDLETGIPKDIKMSLFYIAGYITRKDCLTEEEIFNDTAFYYHEYGSFLKEIDRGDLKVPLDTTVQWVFFCFIMFNAVKSKVCRNSLTKIFMLVSEMYHFNTKRVHGIILSNIFFKNYCLFQSPKSSKEPALKVLKLS